MSLRARLLLGMGAVALVLVVAGAAILRTTEANLLEQVDDQLRAAGPALGRIPRGGPPGGQPEGEGTTGDEAPRLSRLYVGQVGDDGALRTLYSPDLAGAEDRAPALDPDDVARLRAGHAVTVPSEDGAVAYRALARTGGPRGGVTVAAVPLDDVEESVRRLLAVELVAGAAVLGVLGLVGWWVVHLGVQPVRRMTEAAAAIAAGAGQRVPEAAPGTEAAELGAALNQMLDRIDTAFAERAATEDRLRRFLADASHELRTPVATIRGYAELFRAGGLDDDDRLADAMRRTEQEAVRMGELVDDLLHLARLDQGRPLERAPVDLVPLVADAALDAQAVAPERRITVEAMASAVVLGDGARLRQVLANLVGNALVHAPGSPLHLRLAVDGDRAEVEVRDEGPGMGAEEAARAFERFYRADASRQRHSGGSGLGLAIVEATVRAHGGEVALDATPGGGTSVRVRLPLA